MVSSTSAAYNLTVNNTASGAYSLKVMTVVAVIFLPSCWPTRPGPTTCSGGASASKYSRHGAHRWAHPVRSLRTPMGRPPGGTGKLTDTWSG